MRVCFTGGSGKAGKHVIPELLKHGHKVLNVDLVPLDVPGVDNVKADITDEGQVLNAFSMLHNLGELDSRAGASPLPDAVVHFAAIPRILLRPDSEAFRINTMGTYNVLEVCLYRRPPARPPEGRGVPQFPPALPWPPRTGGVQAGHKQGDLRVKRDHLRRLLRRR